MDTLQSLEEAKKALEEEYKRDEKIVVALKVVLVLLILAVVALGVRMGYTTGYNDGQRDAVTGKEVLYEVRDGVLYEIVGPITD